MRGRRAVSLLAFVAMLAALAACSGASAERPTVATAQGGDDVITVGSFDFAESHLLAEVYSQALEAGGYRVERAYDLGPREIVVPALIDGFVDFVPEYAGTALQFLSLGTESAYIEPSAAHEALVRAAALKRLTALEPADAEDKNTFVVTRETADRYGLQTLSDVRPVAGELRFGGSPECPTRPLCLRGLRDVYGLEFAEVVGLRLDLRLSKQALLDELVHVALMFTTDPELEDERLVELVDDQRLQPAENVTPLVRADVVERYGPSFVEVVDGVSSRLNTDTLRVLNSQMASDGAGLESVASAWLAASGAGVARVD